MRLTLTFPFERAIADVTTLACHERLRGTCLTCHDSASLLLPFAESSSTFFQAHSSFQTELEVRMDVNLAAALETLCAASA